MGRGRIPLPVASKIVKLAKRLQREVQTHPGKAAVLGVLALVAGYFWTPLVWGWLRPADTAVAASLGPQAADGQHPQPTPVARSTDATAPPKTDSVPWETVAAWIDADPDTRPADLNTFRNPFQPTAKEAEKPPPETAQPVEPPPKTPQSLGVELTGTIVGPTRRVALISGRAYGEGDTIVADAGGTPVEWTLGRVTPRGIILRSQDERYELTLPQSRQPGRIITRSRPKN